MSSSIIQPKRLIEDGDLVIIYVNFKQTYALTVETGKTFQTRFGALRHDHLVGRPYGSKVYCTKGYVYALCPTPELYTQNLHHRTQILYSHDIALVTTMLELKPGSRLAEAGTGSGGFTHAAARTLAPDGLLYTFEVDEDRFRLAAEDFARHVLTHLIRIQQKDVCKDGFGLTDAVDAVFLDLPRPWDVVQSAKTAMKLKEICRFCSFSPCIEQVQRTCEQLRNLNFVEIDVVECIPKVMKVVDVPYEPDYCIFDSKTTATASDEPLAKMAKLDTSDIAESYSDSMSNKAMRKFSSKPFTSCVAHPIEQPTHTGYLTFATLLPRA